MLYKEGLKLMEGDKSFKIEKAIVTFFFLLIVYGTLELVAFGYAVYSSDEFECNYIWCSFSKSKSIINQECYENGIKVNCSNMFNITEVWHETIFY